MREITWTVLFLPKKLLKSYKAATDEPIAKDYVVVEGGGRGNDEKAEAEKWAVNAMMLRP